MPRVLEDAAEVAEQSGSDQPQPRKCSLCDRGPLRVYYLGGKSVLCEDCRLKLQADADQRPGWQRFWTAALAGLLAAAIGSIAYFEVAKHTGYRYGVAALVLGLMVGGAVRWGARSRGGRLYQTLAVLLAYSSISVTYLPALFKAIHASDTHASATDKPKPAAQPGTAPVAGTPASGASTGSGAPSKSGSTESGAAIVKSVSAGNDASAAKGAAAASNASAQRLGAAPQKKPATPSAVTALVDRLSHAPRPMRLLVGCVLLYLLSLPLPILSSSPIGWLITGIAVYEAWKLNKPKAIVISGPISV